MPVSRLTLCVALLLAATSHVALAIFIQPTGAPVERLLANATAFTEEHPDDPHGYYVLGRLHYLAWSLNTGTLPQPYTRQDGKPVALTDHTVHLYLSGARHQEAQRRVKEETGVEDVNALDDVARAAFYRRVNEVTRALRQENWTPPPRPTVEQRDGHADAALKNFRIAIDKDGDNGLYHLGIASLAEQYAPRAAERKLAFEGDEPAATEEVALKQWRSAALKHYERAYNLSKQEDAAREHRPITGIESLVSYEAAQAYPRVAGEVGDDAGDAALIAEMAEHLKRLAELPWGPITPIVMSFGRHDSLAHLIDADAAVAFDLDGTGRPQRWTWPHGDTGMLVWDPGDTGRITSGRQLFGSVSWWIMPRDGYHALDLLDDNRDGELAGDELQHLALWFDRNGNGRSEPGEVIPLHQLPIDAIVTRSSSMDGDSPMNGRGVRLTSGDWLPTYDWLAQPK